MQSSLANDELMGSRSDPLRFQIPSQLLLTGILTHRLGPHGRAHYAFLFHDRYVSTGPACWLGGPRLNTPRTDLTPTELRSPVGEKVEEARQLSSVSRGPLAPLYLGRLNSIGWNTDSE